MATPDKTPADSPKSKGIVPLDPVAATPENVSQAVRQVETELAPENESRVRELGFRISDGTASINEVSQFVSLLLPHAVNTVNSLFAPRQLVKRDRKTEPLPTDKRQLSSYRTRIGTMLEYAISQSMDALILRLFGSDLRLTFAVAHEYPDFYVRDASLSRRVQIEMKAVDADSDEQAARFEVLSSLINAEEDLVVMVGWAWCNGTLSNGTAYEHPEIFSFIVVPASDLAAERDKSVELRGGRVDERGIFVASKGGTGELTRDKGNAGKILRLIHHSRKSDAFALSEAIQQYLQFIEKVESQAKLRRVQNKSKVASVAPHEETPQPKGATSARRKQAKEKEA